MRIALLLCQLNWDTAGWQTEKLLCPKLGGCDEEFYRKRSKVGLLVRSGCVQGLHSSTLFSGNLDEPLVPGLRLVFWSQKNADIFQLLGFNSIKNLFIMLSLRQNQYPDSAVPLILGCPSLIFESLPFLD